MARKGGQIVIKAIVNIEDVEAKLKGSPFDLLTELQILNLYVLEEIVKFCDINATQLAKEMSKILIETIEERSNK